MEDLINRVIRLRQEIEEGSKVDVIEISVELIKIESEIRAVNFTDSCEKLKKKETPTFWSWVNDNKLTVYQDGVFYNGNCYLISDLYRKYKREIEPNL